MDATAVTDLSGRLVDELSGGQRQRVWVAMALAQHTDILLLDEPTTFLDIAHQIELMELFTDLNHVGHTLVAVLHDLNQAARYGTHLIAMKDGAVVAEGTPSEIVTAELVEEVFGLRCLVVPDPVGRHTAVVPLGRDRPSRTVVTGGRGPLTLAAGDPQARRRCGRSPSGRRRRPVGSCCA